jgi:hypothetical protein
MPPYGPDETVDYPIDPPGEPADRAAWQADALAAPTVPYTDQLACARMELRRRQDVYARRSMHSAEWLEHQLQCQAAIIDTLERLVAVYAPPAAQETLPL